MNFIMAVMLFMAFLTVSSPAAAQSTADQQFLFAYKLMQRGDTAEAGQAFDEFLERYPQSEQLGDATYFRAAIHRQAGELKEAAARLTNAPTPKRVPMFALQLLNGQVLTDLGEYEKAIENLEKVDRSKLPDQAVASVLMLKGMAYRGAGNLTASESALRDAATISSPLRGRAFLELARSQAQAGSLEAALKSLDKTLETEDATITPEAARYAGDVAYESGDFDRAGAYYTKVTDRFQSSPEYGRAVTGRMWADLRSGRNISVVNQYKQLLDTLPDDQKPVATYLVGSAYQALDQHEQAATHLATYTEAAADLPLMAQALYKLAVSQFELSRPDDMRRTVARLDQAFPESEQRMDAAFLVAAADAKQGRAGAGAARLKVFIDRGAEDPYYLQALLRRAALYEQNDEPEAAADDFKQYLADYDGKPSDVPSVTLRYADLSHRLGRYDNTIELCNQLLAAKPSADVEQEAMYRLGEAQTRKGDFDDALATFDKLQKAHPLNPYRHAVDLRRGLLLSRLGKTEQAMKVLITAADDAKLPEDQRLSALRIIAARMRDTERPDDAAVTLRRMEAVAGLGTLNDRELLWLGRYEVDRQKSDDALTVLETFNKTDRKAAGPDESELLFLRGRSNFQLENYEPAHKAFFGVVAIGQGFDLEARLYLARTAAALGDTDAALIELSDLVNSRDSRIQAEALYEEGKVRRQRADLELRRGNNDAARAELLDARAKVKRMVLLNLTVDELYPLPAQGLVAMSEIAKTLGEPDVMQKELNELARAFPETPYATYARAVLAQEARGRADDALVLLKQIETEKLDPILRRKVEQRVKQLEALR